ncbi:hypothetical protein OIU76_002295 [Salix suchowensis]|uniref:Uncharacterized protein n=2 Tax=Salix TaxID=40685 RepID=A0A9Q0P5V2_9ROSI|nr:hypothetical protein OIU76_002295 [Salix suchowensis]KAJ6398395.1 hypothetical protein OIU77_019238 [Salix suchowensis]KAJ6682161.1 hypothetical protein OIU74_020413 [Salix koriyanagi]
MFSSNLRNKLGSLLPGRRALLWCPNSCMIETLESICNHFSTILCYDFSLQHNGQVIAPCVELLTWKVYHAILAGHY